MKIIVWLDSLKDVYLDMAELWGKEFPGEIEMEIKETSNMVLDEFIGRDIRLMAGRSNSIVVDAKVFIHNVRSIFFANGDASHVEFVCYDETMNTSELYVYNVSSIVVESVYGEQLLFIDEKA